MVGARVIKIEDEFDVPCAPCDAWRLIEDINRFATCIPTLIEHRIIDDTHIEGRVGVRLGLVPVSSRISIDIVERRAPTCIKALGVSYLGEAVAKPGAKSGGGQALSRDSVGTLDIHIDLRDGEAGGTRVKYVAGVEAEGRLRRIYEMLIKTKVPEFQREFREKLAAALGRREEEVEEKEKCNHGGTETGRPEGEETGRKKVRAEAGAGTDAGTEAGRGLAGVWARIKNWWGKLWNKAEKDAAA
jgi:carbon monoxide dehydrogenase subunit G